MCLGFRSVSLHTDSVNGESHFELTMLTENEAPCQLNRRGIIEIFEDIGEYMYE